MARVVLVGLPGSGKSTVGPALARRLSCGFVDLDAEIEVREGRSAAAIIRDAGIDDFRRMEADVLDEVIGRDAVIATGGGAVETSRVRESLSGEHVVWLDAPDAILVERVALGDRPLLDGDVADRVAQLRARRAAAYREIAGEPVSSLGDLDLVVERILDRLGGAS